MSTESKPKSKTSTYIAAIALIVIILAGVGYYYHTPTTTGPTTRTGATTAAATSAAPRYKDILIVGTTDSVQSTIDPSDAYDYFGINMIQNLGAPLVDFAPGGATQFVPALATTWASSSDGLTWTLNLRQNVKFYDGSCCFNASTVKYSFDRAIGVANPDSGVVGVGYSDIIKSVDVPSTYQVVFRLKIPFAPFLSVLTFGASYIVNPSLAPFKPSCTGTHQCNVNYTAGKARQSTPVDFGPYVLSSWTRQGGKDTEIRLDANPYYWNASGYPKTPHIIIKFYSDATALALAMKNGEIDLAYRQIAPNDLNDFKTNSAVKVWTGTGAFIQYLVLQERIKPFDNPLVRRAIAAAVDRPTLTSTVFRGQAIPLYSMIPAGMFGHQDVFKLYGDANYTYTKQVLSQLGYSATNKLVIDLWYPTGHYTSTAEIATVLKSSLEASGVMQVNLHVSDWPTYRGNQRAESMPAWILGWYPDYVDPDDYMYPFIHSSGSSWIHYHYNSTQTDKIVDSARATSDPALRMQFYGQAQNQLVTDVPIVPLFQGGAFAVSKPNVSGVVLDVTQIFRFYLVYAPQS